MPKPSQSSRDLRAKWLKRLSNEESAHKDWRKYAADAECEYFTDTNKNTDTRPSPIKSYPLFPSTIKVIHGRVFSQPPKPDVRKRYTDDPGRKPAGAPVSGQPQQPQPQGMVPPNGMGPSQPNAAQGAALGQPVPAQVPTVDDNKLAQCIERALGYVIDTTSFDADSHAAVTDLLVASCGVAKIEMETETETVPVLNPVTGDPILLHKDSRTPIDPSMEGFDPGMAEPATEERIVDQTVNLRHFSWSQFHWEPQQHWSQVGWIAFDHWMTKPAIEDRFGVTIQTDGATNSGGGVVGGDPKKPDAAKYKDLMCVHEIWDKKNKQRLFVSQEYEGGVLAKENDPLGLKGFFPCPQPMMLNIRGDDLVPMPDYTYCQTLFTQCNELSNRIGMMIKQVREVGFYDSSVPELAGVRGNPPDGTYIPIAGLAQRIAQAGGKGDGTINSVLARWDNSVTVEVIQELLQMTDAFKQRIWEIYGVPDILRGSTDPNETATAQSIKAQWADVRIGEKVRIIALFFRDVFRIMAEIMAEKFQPDILEKMTGIQLNELEIEVLRSDYGRCYAIDVESDSTVVQDEYAEKQQRMEFLNTITGFSEKIMPSIQQGVMPADLGKELMLFALNTFKNGRQMEQAVQSLPDSMAQLGRMNQQIQALQQQLKAANDQAAATQKQLQAVNMQKEQRENIKTSVDAGKTQADTQHTEVETAKLAQDIHQQTLRPANTPKLAA